MKKAIRIVLLLFLFSSVANAATRKELIEIPKSSLWLGAGTGFVLGFGSGQAIEGRWDDAGWPFAVADGVGLSALLLTFGDCMSCSSQATRTRNAVRAVGTAVFLTSRILQVGELLFYGVGHGMLAKNANQSEPPKLTTAAMPTPDGQGALITGTFRF